MRRFVLSLLASSLCVCAIAQTTTPPDPTATSVAASIPNFTMPAGIVVTGNFNQLGTPRWTGGFGAIYPFSEKLGIYGVTGAEFYPTLAIYSATGQKFYALNAIAEQEVYKRMKDFGWGAFYVGIGGGPSISSPASPGDPWHISAAGDVVTALVFKIHGPLKGVFSPKGQFIQGAGWNLIPRLGIKLDLSKSGQ